MRWEAEIADAPDALTTRFHEVHAKSALNKVAGFARPTHEFLGLNAGADFEREIVVKVNVAEVLRTELARPRWKGEHVASPRARLDALRQLADAGLDVGVVIAPLLPGINDSAEQIEEIVAAAEDAGAESIDALPLHLRGATKRVFFEWLRAKRSELVPRYEALYGDGSELRRDEHRRLLELVKPRDRTWEQRIHERFDTPSQLPLF